MVITCPKCHYENPSDYKFCKKCATPLSSLEDISDLPTKNLKTPIDKLNRRSTFAGRYEVIEELDKGGMGEVYRVFDKKMEEEVTLKLIRPEIAADRKTIERFRNELKFARKIAHKNVCRMYDLNEEEGTPYITMEYVPGENLKSIIAMTKQLSVSTAVNIAKQICEGLAEALRLGVVHRDLKPSNIMIDKQGNARILDFGIARSLKAKGITGAGVMIGTPEYMSPEQVEEKEVDQRSDLYALGVILYEMMTGRIPFEGDSALSIALKHKTEVPPDPREINAQIPEDLSRVILRCMEKDKEKRYQNAEELLSELSKIEKGISTPERMVSKRKTIREKISEMKWKRLLIYGVMAILIISLIVGGIYLITGRREVIHAIAVLPLANLSDDPQQEYFADGMTEALIGELTKIKALQRVISRTSVMRYKNTDKSLPEIARELNVDVVVEGSVLLIGKQVRMAAKLIDARKDRHIWANSYNRDLQNILGLQRELARSIAKEIKIAVTPEEQAQLTEASPVNPEAYQLYLKGRYVWNKRTRDDLEKALEYFGQAIEKDPNSALAYTGLADTYAVLPGYADFPPTEAYSKAKEAAQKALAIDDTLAEAHTSLANVTKYYRDWISTEKGYKRAIELSPNYATAHHWYAYDLMLMGRFDESMAEINLAQELDPYSLIINANVGFILYHARRYDQAIEHYRNRLEMDPSFWLLHMYLGRALVQIEKYEEAIVEFQEAINLSGRIAENLSALCYGYAISGRRAEAMKILSELNQLSMQEYVSPYLIAIIYVGLGLSDQAFEWLYKAVENPDILLVHIKVDPLFDSIRPDPRFKELLKKVGLN
jgi:serine/threonine protein kinase/tetratricopeptide (TPR) repeat protein